MSKTQIFRTPWTTDEILGNAVFVLLRDNLVQDNQDNSILFYALPGNRYNAIGKEKKPLEIRKGTLSSFLETHKDKIVVTYDAVRFHDSCIKELINNPQAQGMVWNFSRKHLLWDLGLLERQIQYTHSGSIIACPALNDLFIHWLGSEQSKIRPDNQVGRLRTILEKQLNWAVHELPIFKTTHEPDASAFITDRVTNEDFCYRILRRANPSCSGHDDDMDDYPKSIEEAVDVHRVYRRQNLALSGKTGPLGIGSELQSSLLASAMKQAKVPIDHEKLKTTTQVYLDKVARKMLCSNDVLAGLAAAYRKKEDVKKFVHKLHSEVESLLSKKLRCIGVPLETVLEFSDKITENHEDRMRYRSVDDVIRIWSNLEEANDLFSRHKKECTSFGKIHDFPVFQSDRMEALTDITEEAILNPSEGNVFLEIRLNEVDLRSILATNVALYGLLPEIISTKYEDIGIFRDSLYEYLSTELVSALRLGIEHFRGDTGKRHLGLDAISLQEYVQNCGEELQESSYDEKYKQWNSRVEEDHLGRFQRYLDYIEKTKDLWQSLPLNEQKTMLEIISIGCLILERVEETHKRLSTKGISIELNQVILLRTMIWELIVSCKPIECPTIPAFVIMHSSLESSDMPKGEERSDENNVEETTASTIGELESDKDHDSRKRNLLSYLKKRGSDGITENMDESLPKSYSTLIFDSPAAPLESVLYKSDDLAELKYARSLIELPFHLAINHICSKTGLSRAKVSLELGFQVTNNEKRYNIVKPSRSWSIINHLVGRGARIKDYFLYDRDRFPNTTKEVEAFFQTNTVSPSGRIGRPIHYINSLAYDFELMRDDIPARIAFEFLAQGEKIVWVSKESILLEITEKEAEKKLLSTETVARKVASDIFRSSSVLYADFDDWLGRGLCQCQILDSWPNGNIHHHHSGECHIPTPPPICNREKIIPLFMSLMRSRRHWPKDQPPELDRQDK